jgi:Lrp/AsnC family leucine-responsive transcriptional regulator
LSIKLDEIDLKIIKSLTQNCRKTTSQIAKEARISRPTAIARMKALEENRVIDFSARVNLTTLGLKLALVTYQVDETQMKQDVLAKVKNCPRILQLLRTVNSSVYTALIFAENTETKLSAIDCIRSVLNAKTISSQRVKPVLGETFDLKIFLEKCELTPCGKKCGICSNYEDYECIGCPATKCYKGPL